jgi:hypothetical protein
MILFVHVAICRFGGDLGGVGFLLLLLGHTARTLYQYHRHPQESRTNRALCGWWVRRPVLHRSHSEVERYHIVLGCHNTRLNLKIVSRRSKISIIVTMNTGKIHSREMEQLDYFLLCHIISYVERYQYRFVAIISKRFHSAYGRCMASTK